MTELLIPIGPLYNEDGTVNIENTMRTHRFVQYADWKRWKASQDPAFPKDKLPKEEFYTREFLDIMANNKDGILEKLPYVDASGTETKGLPEQSRKTIGYMKSYLSKTSLSPDEARRIRATMRKYLKGCPMADPFEYKRGEFRTDERTDEEKTMDLFLKENYRRPADRPFSRELLRRVTEQAFLDRLTVPYTCQELDKDTGELQTKEYPPVPESDIAAIAAIRGKTDSMDTQQLLGASKKVGFILYKCAFAKERLATKDKRQRREVSPQSKPRMIYSELRLECGELYADRNPSRGKYRGKLGTGFSDSLLLTITDENVMKTIGIPEGKDLVSGEGENAFLSDSFEMKVPIKDKYGIDYTSVYAARIAASVDSEERRRQIAAMPVSEIWKTPEAKASMESENNNAPTLRRALVELKYKNNPDLAELLVNTGDARIMFGKSGKMDKTTVLLRSSIAKGKGIDIPDTAWFRDWRQKILEHKEDLQSWWKSLSEGDKDSFNICMDVFVSGKFREYKAKHPKEFPQFAPPTQRNR